MNLGMTDDMPPFDEEYDVVILGTGLKECILSGLLSADGKKVLNLDTNGYYGGDSASVNLQQVYTKCEPDTAPEEKKLGRSRDYLIDLSPKFIMASGNLTKVLLRTKVTRYLEFRSVKGSFVYKDGKIHKVPSNAQEALNSGLMGPFQKRKFKNMLEWIADFDPRTNKYQDPNTTTTRQVFDYWGLDENTQAFVGHAMALHPDDTYLDQMFAETLQKVQLYAYSVTRYGNSPYVYPMYGLGGLPEGFARLCAVNGGTQAFSAPYREVMYDSEGKVCGVQIGKQTIRTRQVISDPSYFRDTDLVRKVGQVACWLFILDHPIEGFGDIDSCQIIIPFRHSGRRTDLYISFLSSMHGVAPKGRYLAMIGVVESENPKADMQAGRALLGGVLKDFFFVRDVLDATNDGRASQLFITKSLSAQTHFEQATNEVIEMYERITGTRLDLDAIDEDKVDQ